MQPSTGSSKSQCIHINPAFKNGVIQKLTNTGAKILNLPIATHINPLFMQPPKISTTIHMNPDFLTEKIMQQKPNCFPDNLPLIEEPPIVHMNPDFLTEKIMQQELNSFPDNVPLIEEPPIVPYLNKIISKSRTRIVRESHTKMKAQMKSTSSSNDQLLVLTKRKLIRVSPTLNSEILRRKERLKSNNKVFSLTGVVPLLKRRPGAFVAQFALRRSNSMKKTNVITSRISAENKPQKDVTVTSMNKQLRLININGILYKSTGNKLQRKIDSTAVPDTSQTRVKNQSLSCSKFSGSIKIPAMNPVGRNLFVRGAKYVMDPTGFKLTRVTQTSICRPPSTAVQQTKLKTGTTSFPHTNLPRRIDIGGVTYISSSQSKNVFVRTSTHLVLAHLNQAKQRSVHVLSRSLKKTNKPCLIFQRLGKCAALERNRCSKVHDKERIMMCPKFLQGQCSNTDCLLSHNKTLEKMPVCRFFLQGSCVRNDCRYLHKKLRDDSEICEDFRRGYCALAEQCNKQHIFTKTKLKANVSQGPRKNILQNTKADEAVPSTETALYRYFNGESLVLGAHESDSTVSKDSVLPEDAHLAEETIDHNDDSIEKARETTTAENQNEKPRKRKKLGALPSFIPLS